MSRLELDSVRVLVWLVGDSVVLWACFVVVVVVVVVVAAEVLDQILVAQQREAA